MNYVDEEDELAETIGEAIERSRERESRGRIEGIREESATPIGDYEADAFLASETPAARPVPETPAGDLVGSRTTETAPETAEELSDEDAAYLEWQDDSDPLAPGNAPPDRGAVFAREAELAAREGDSRGAETMRSYRPAPVPGPEAEMSFTEEELYPEEGSFDVVDPFEREAEMAEREGDAAGAALMRSYPRKGGSKPIEEADDFDMVISPEEAEADVGVMDGAADALEGYDLSAIDELSGATAEPFDMEIPLEDAEADQALYGLQGADAADRGAEYASGYATDEDPELPGRLNPAFAEGAPGGQGPGGWASDEDPILDESFDMVMPEEDPEAALAAYPADDNEALEASMGIDDDELAESPGSALAAPWSPETDETGFATSAELGGPVARPGAKTPTVPGSDPLALDAGLPTEENISGERGWDVLRQITGRIGNALRVAGGGAHRDIEQVAPRLEEERREGIASRTAAKGATAAADRRQAIEDAPTELELAQEERRRTDSERRFATDSRRLAVDESRVAGTEAERDRLAAERDARINPGSDLSRAAQERLRMELDAMSTSARLRPVAEAYREGLARMSAEDVERIEESDLMRPFLNRDGGAGTGGGAVGAAGMSRSDRAEALIQHAITRRNMPEAVARAAYAADPEGFARSILSDTMISGRAGEAASRRADAAAAANEVVPGVPVRAEIDVNAPEARGIRNRVERYRSGWVSLNEIERIANEHGAGAVIRPEIRAEIEPYLFDLIGMGAAVQNSGTLNAGERPIIAATLPNPASIEGMTLGSFVGALRGWRGLLRNATGAAVSVVAPGARNRSAAEYFLRTGEVYEDPAPAGGAGGEPVRVRDPVSRAEFEVPAATWAAASEDERAALEVLP